MDRWGVVMVAACLLAPQAALAQPPELAVPRAAERPIAVATRWVRRDLDHFLSRRTLVILGAGGAMAGVAAAHEDPQAIVHDLSGRTWEDASNVGNAWGNGAIAVGLAGTMLIAGHVTGDSTMFVTGFEIARAFVYTGVLVEGLKVMANRTRPDGGKYSFPSGHAAIATSMVPVLARRYGFRVGVPAGVLAGLTSIGRLEDRRHYVSDVLFGSALGLSVGLAVSDRDPAHDVALALTDHGAALTLRF
jgi:membrane-associated phospholipid phosphatase